MPKGGRSIQRPSTGCLIRSGAREAPPSSIRGGEGEAPADAAEAYYAHGADWGQAVDYTVIVTLRCDVRPLPLVAAYRSRRRPWPVMIAVLNDRMARYPGGAAHDHTGGGRVVGEYVIAPILDVDMVGQRRRDLWVANS